MFRIIFQMSFFCKDEVQIIIGLSKLKSNLNNKHVHQNTKPQWEGD